jgi:hypothetical protein
MKPADLLKQAEVLVMYLKKLPAPEWGLPLLVLDALNAIDEKADEVYNQLQDEARGNAP